MSADIQHYNFWQKLQALPFVEKILLFGSRARQDHLEKADIDIAVLCPSATNYDWLQVVDIVDEADTLLRIDCVRLDKLQQDSLLRRNIEQEGVILYVKN